MSTKATRATLQIVTDRLEDNLAEEGLSRAQRESYEHQLSLARESLAEVEAIERAAKAITNGDTEEADSLVSGPAMALYDAAMGLLESIAKEAP